MLSRPLAIVSGSFLLSLSVLSYYFLRKRNRVAEIAEVKRAQVVDSKASKSSTPFVFQKENLSRESTEKLNNLLNSSDADVRYQALVTIQQATAFTANFAVLRDSACLESMLSLLTTDDVSKLTNRQNLCILQILTNMVCDMSCLEVVKKHIDKIVNFACIREYSDVVCAALQVLGNVALTHTGCRVLDCKLPHLMNMLEASDPYILRQVLAVLVNLSCDTESCYLILTSEISDAFVRRMSDTLTPSTQPMVLLQLVNLLKNLYKMSTSMGDDPKPCTDVMTTRDFLLNSKVAIKVRVQFILAEPSIADIHKELVQQAQSLLSLLNGPTVQKPLVPMTGLVDRVLSAYNQYQSFPILQRARISPALPQTGAANWSIESEWEQKDVVRGEKFNFSQHHFLTMDNSNPPIVNISCLTGPQLTSLGQGFPFPKENGAKVVWNIFTSTLRAICITYERTVSMKTASPVTQACCPASGTFVQLWNHGQFVKTIQLPSTGSTALHGRVYPLEDGNTFGGACWSHDSKKIVYTAEAHTPDESSDTAAKSSPFHYRENWGEGLQDTQRTVLCLLDIDSEHVQSLVDEQRLPDMTPTQPIWCPSDTGIVFAAYAMGPYRLGLKYCQQRPCQLFYLELETKRISTLSALDKSAGCPRFSPDGRNLVWLENSVGGPHMQCRALMHLNWPVPPLGTASPAPVVPVVDQPEKRGGFPGLNMNLPRRCWTSDSSHVILSTKWGFEEVMLIVPITCPAQTPRVYPIASPLESEGPSSVTVMDVCHDIVVAGISSPIRPPFLGVLPLPNDWTELKQSSNFKWTIITPGSSEATLPVISNVGYSVLRSPDLTNCSESLLIRSHPDAFQSSESDRMEHAPAEFKSPALIVWPHGGPHAAFSASWEPMIPGFIQLGFACLLVNYRGSLGYGDAAVNSLLGHIGDMDVKDCVEATECALDTLELKFAGNRPNVYLFGGSHGGFLVLHLAAISGSQLKFKAVVARNPVANLISMCDTSDIPDWDYTEAGLTDGLWPMGSILDSVGLEKLSSVSPITRLNSDWTVPLLMLLGEQDRRVPSSQGLTFCRRLKALNPSVPCEIIVYPHDAHPLDSPITAKDVFLRAMLWFLKHP